MKTKKIIGAAITIVGLGLISSCSPSPNKAKDGTVKEVVFSEAAKDFKITSEFNSAKFIQLQATDECIISDIKRIISVEDMLVVLTTDEEILCFNKDDGKFLRKIGNKGEGPGEYLQIGDIYYNDKDGSINVIDVLKKSMVAYSLDGKHISNKKTEVPIDWMVSAERSSDGYTMVCKMIAGGFPSSEHAYTIIKPNDEFINIDPFAPVKTDGYSESFASCPMAAGEDGITFLKFLNDTVFTLSEGNVYPMYKLSMKKKMPQKDVVAQMGSFGKDLLMLMGKDGSHFSGFDKLFETENHIALIPTFDHTEGYYWINKETGAGTHISSSNELSVASNLMIQGRSIINIAGANEDEIISRFMPEHIKNVQKELAEKSDLKPFDTKLKAFFEKADPEGNPCLIIYSED